MIAAADWFKTFNLPVSRGTSDAALFVAHEGAMGLKHLRDSVSLGSGISEVLAELDAVADECGHRDWDGDGAIAVSSLAHGMATRVVLALPIGMPMPSIGAEPDGDVTLEWHKSLKRTLSVSVGRDGNLHYAALLGARTAYGTEPFLGEVPAVILELIGRVLAR